MLTTGSIITSTVVITAAIVVVTAAIVVVTAAIVIIHTVLDLLLFLTRNDAVLLQPLRQLLYTLRKLLLNGVRRPHTPQSGP